MIERADNLLVPNGVSGIIEIHKNNISFRSGKFVIHKDDIYSMEMVHNIYGYVRFRFRYRHPSNKCTDIYDIDIYSSYSKRVHDMFISGFNYKIDYNEFDILEAKRIISDVENRDE